MIEYINHITKNTLLSTQEAWWLLEHITHKNQASLRLEATLSDDQKQQLQTYIDQIARQDKPLAYILGWIPFLDLKIQVQPPILIPRPETEQWVHELITSLQPYADKIHQILDIGTGSGVIALSLAKALPKVQIFAIDINPQAIALTKQNAQLHGIKNITTLESDLFTNIPASTKFDLIVSNPPYIDPMHLPTMQNSVKNWEDHAALFSHKQGLEIIQTIMHQAGTYLTNNSEPPYQLVFEHDCTQQAAIEQIGLQTSWQCITRQDLFGKPRTTWCKKT